MGRPTNNPKNKLIHIRIDNDSINKLDYLAEKKKENRSEIIRQGIAELYDQEKK